MMAKAMVLCKPSVSPDPPPLEFVGDSLEPEHPPPRFRIKGKQGLDELLAEDPLPAPPLPPPAEAPAPEGLVPVEVEEEVARVARVSLEDLEGFAKELVEEDWDLDDALWVMPGMQSTALVATQSWVVPPWGCSRDFRGYLR